MTTSVYLINKGINKPIIFHGLRAQYILYAGAIITGDMLLLAEFGLLKKRAARKFPGTIRSHSRHTFIDLKKPDQKINLKNSA